MAAKQSTPYSVPDKPKASGIDPSVVRFIVALVVVGGAIEVISAASPKAAWIIVVILVLGLMINNPEVSRALNGLGVSLRGGL